MSDCDAKNGNLVAKFSIGFLAILWEGECAF